MIDDVSSDDEKAFMDDFVKGAKSLSTGELVMAISTIGTTFFLAECKLIELPGGKDAAAELKQLEGDLQVLMKVLDERLPVTA